MGDVGGFIRQTLRRAFDEGNPTVRAAVLGAQVDDFLSSDIGKYLMGKADRDITEAVELLKRASPWRRRRIIELQNRIHVAERFKNWILEAYQEGLVALQAIDNEEEHGEPNS